MQKDELVIRTRREADNVVQQFIPRLKLKGDFPTHFIENHLHWLDVLSGDLELRDLENPWPKNKLQSWFIPYSGNVLELGQGERLVDVRSSTTAMISSVLRPLESTEFIDVRYAAGTGVVTAHLPRLKLDFFINSSRELECRQFPGMVVDRDQNIGTLVGLENRLVVHQSSIRSVIIPYGEVHFETCDYHVRVHIDTGKDDKVKYHIYTIDSRLGRLVGNGSLTSHLYKIFLHAVTAYCLPDPLTRGAGTHEPLAGRTGTEEALAGLRAAVTWSFQTLDGKGVEAYLLKQISSLTPDRVYYPVHLKVMQTVKWKRLSSVSQHEEFHMIVSSIFAHASRFHIFQEGNKGSEALSYDEEKRDRHLLEKAAIRSASYRTEEFGGSLAKDSGDSIYSARDLAQNSEEEAEVLYVSEMVARWPSRMSICSRLMGVLEGWGELKSVDEGFKLGYDRKWLTQNLADVWCQLYKSLQESTQQLDTYRLMFLLSTLSYSKKVDLRLIETLLAFATVPRFQYLTLPPYSSYNLEQGFSPSRDILIAAVKDCVKSFGGSDEASLSKRYNEHESDLARRRYQTYEENSESQSISYADDLISQWPCASPSAQGRDYRLINMSQAMEKVTPLFESWYRNKRFKEHLNEVQSALNSIDYDERKLPRNYSFEPCRSSQCSMLSRIHLKTLLEREAPVLGRYTPASTDLPRRSALALIDPPVSTGSSGTEPTPEPPTTDDHLKSLLQEFQCRSSTDFEKSYARDLLKSFGALKSRDISTDSEKSCAGDSLESFGALKIRDISANDECQRCLEEIFRSIQQNLMPVGAGELMTYRAGLWPRISPMSLLQLLSGNASIELSPKWKHVLVTYGKAITTLQRSERLLNHDPKARVDGNGDFAKESENTGHQQWDPIQQPDWLLIEIENDFLVRPVQVEIALKMISPPSSKNTVMQLFMGEGKTSVIVPIVAAALADGKKLVRVVVLKPLSGQMFQMLVQKLGGLVNRRIFYMPFSRGVKITQKSARAIRLLYEECMESGGIFLVQPEHVLSFKLVGLEWLHNSKENKKINQDNGGDEASDGKVADMLLDTQRWLEKYSRDILDESDEIMNVRHELIYTIGSSKHIENHPDRWSIVQEIFGLMRARLNLGGFDLQDLEIETPLDHQGCFPFTRILNHEAGRELLKDIASDIIAGNDLPFPHAYTPISNRAYT